MEREMTFYEVLQTLAQFHIKFKTGGYSDLIHFDLKNKTVSNGKTVLMKDGKIVPQKIDFGNGIEIELYEDMELIRRELPVDPYDVLEELYKQYKTSMEMPYSNYNRANFRAKRLNELSREEFNGSVGREIARIALEGYVLLTEFPWKNEKHFFYQGKDKDLILYKEWAM